jgi:hypothetical protein
MNCEWVNTNGTLYLYDELADDARHEIEQHMSKCAACAREMDTMRLFHRALSRELPVQDPSASMLAASRMKLQEALEGAQQAPGWTKWTVDVAGWLHQIRFSPALAAVLIMIGFGSGIVATYTSIKPASISNNSGSQSPQIANIIGITPDPNDNKKVSINYNKLIPEQAQGSLDDPQIQQLLLYAARSNYNSGVRLDSIDLLTQNPNDAKVREALIYALRYDKNPGVRLKAMEGLKPYVKGDVRVRDAMLEALLRDTNSGVRTEAIRALQPVTADSSVRATLAALAEQDSNKFIRTESRRVLSTLPEIQ